MTRVNLVKYGFIRYPEEDFSDDGNRFTCYRFSDTNSHISKLVADGQVYLSAHVSGNLPYETYSKLPYYNEATWTYNGVSLSTLTDAMLQDFFNACVMYEKEYQAAEATIKYPSLEELTEQCKKIYAKRLVELGTVEDLMRDHSFEAAVKFSEYEWKTLQQYIKELILRVKQYDPKTHPQKLLGKQYSFNFVKPTNNDLKDSFYYTYIIEMFQKYLII